jgi:hypothetical protein
MDPKMMEMSEKAFQAQVVGLAQLLGWEWMHVRHSPEVKGGKITRYTTPTMGTLGKGWPDLVLVRERDRRLIFAELKSKTGGLSTEQSRVLDVLRSLNGGVLTMPMAEVYVWRPADIDTIATILS